MHIIMTFAQLSLLENRHFRPLEDRLFRPLEDSHLCPLENRHFRPLEDCHICPLKNSHIVFHQLSSLVTVGLAIARSTVLADKLESTAKPYAIKATHVQTKTHDPATITDLTEMDCCEKNGPELWRNCSGVQLYPRHKEMLESHSSWLDEQLINAAQSLLKK